MQPHQALRYADAGAEVTVEGCNCLQQYKYTDPDTGMYTEVRNGSCIKTGIGTLPWCYVDSKTCSGQPLLRNGYFWDNCFPSGAQLLYHHHVAISRPAFVRVNQ